MVAPNPFSFKHLIFCREAVQSLAELVLVSSKFVPYPVLAASRLSSHGDQEDEMR